MARLTLQIASRDAPDGWRADWSVDGRAVGGPISIVGPAVVAPAALGRRFLDLFEQEGRSDRKVRPFADAETLRALGRSLLATWFEPAWPDILPRLAGPGPARINC